MLEAVRDEAWKCHTLHDFVLIHLNRLDTLEALDLGKEDVGIQIVVGKHELAQFGELLKFVKVLVKHYQVEPHVDQVHLFD